MYKLQTSVFINRVPQDVFDFLSNPANVSKWQPTIESAEWTSTGVPGVGSTYKQVIKFLGRNSESAFEITAWDRPNHYSYKASKLPFPVDSIETVFSLTSQENGTQVTCDAQIASVGAFRFMEKAIGKQAEKQDRINLDTAKHTLEAG
jgi:carbon monoxide dehydrogenase subunit G